jgi:hypothetical protein
MSSSIVVAAVLLTVAVLSSTSSVDFDVSKNVLARFYPKFAHFYRLATPKFDDDFRMNVDTSYEYYQFVFNATEYMRIVEESLTMLNTDIVERTIVYHPTPSFEIQGSRFFYRRDAQQRHAIEIELVDGERGIFREYQHPNRFFYISSYNLIEFVDELPLSPYYEVTFKCHRSYSEQLPVLSYIDQSIQWSQRYVLDVPEFGVNTNLSMSALADVRNNGAETIVVKAAQLNTGRYFCFT